MISRIIFFLLVSLAALLSQADNAHARDASQGRGDGKCRVINTGVEYCLFRSSPPAGVHVLRIDPARAGLKLLLAADHGRKSRTPAGWCREFGLIAAINAGMYGRDYLTNVGYLRKDSHVYSNRWVKSYKSALAFDPIGPKSLPAVIVDLDEPDAVNRLQDYRSVVQNLRLIKGNGINVWKNTGKKWSEAAVGIDAMGRILFIFSGTPYSMWEFNEWIRSSGIGVVRMMHMEGGSVAGMSIRSGGLTLDLAGDMGTDSGTGINRQWAVPNVIGVQIK